MIFLCLLYFMFSQRDFHSNVWSYLNVDRLIFCVGDYSYLVHELMDLALPFLQILLQHLCFNVSAPRKPLQRCTS